MGRSIPEKLRRFYDQLSGSHQVLIVINADPDAIASAMAIRRLLWRKVPNVTISNINTINRPDNLAMIRLLGVKLILARLEAHIAFRAIAERFPNMQLVSDAVRYKPALGIRSLEKLHVRLA